MAGERILLVQLADIGDLVLATPAMAALREALPHAEIDLFASAQSIDIVPRHLLNKVIPFKKGHIARPAQCSRRQICAVSCPCGTATMARSCSSIISR